MNYTSNLNLYKWNSGDKASDTITEMSNNMDKLDESLAQITSQTTTTNIMNYGVTVDKTGNNASVTTQAIINAANSGKTVIFPEGTYAINQTLVLSQYTNFIANGFVTFKIVADIDVIWITSDNKISGINFDLYSLDTYTHSVFEISSKSISTMASKNNASQYTCIIEKINAQFSNNNTAAINGSLFNIWAKPTDDNSNPYPSYATQFWNVSIKEIYMTGAIGYFMRNWTWNTNYYTTGSSMAAWITGVSIDDVSIFGNVVYGIFDAPDETTVLDEHYRGVNPMWVNKMRFEHGGRTKKFAYLTTGLRVFKNCIPWDWPDNPIKFLYRTLATFIAANPYLHWDYGFADKYSYFDVVDTTGNAVSVATRNSWIDSKLAAYVDSTSPMNTVTGSFTLKNNTPLIIKQTGYKSWQLTRSSNNNLIFVPSNTIDGVDWNYSNQVTINGDTGLLYANSFSEAGTLLSNKYIQIISNALNLTNGQSLISKATGFKSWALTRSSNNTLIFAPSTAADGTTWDFSKQLTVNGDTGNVNAISLSENGTLISSKYAPIMVAPPTTATSTGTTGQMAQDGSYLYICTATNTWKRVAIAAW